MMILLLILAHAAKPASTASHMPPSAAGAAALPHATVSAAMPSADSISSSEVAASGLLHLRVRQRPFEGASSIQVTVRNIQAQKSEATEGSDWVTVIREAKTFDLVKSEAGEEVLGGKLLAEGLYTRVQLDIVSVKVTLKGQQKPAKVALNRLKEVRPFDIDMARVCILTLDFDVARSLIVTDSGEFQFKPVVRFVLKRGAPG
jgi:hypothetical protein